MSRSSPPRSPSFDSSGADDQGTRFSRDTHIGETIGRGEYHWKSGKNDWQVSLERAFNSLDQKGGLFELDPDGEFVEVPFPEGTGKVDRSPLRGASRRSAGRWPPTSTCRSRPAREISKLDRVDDDQPARKFFRPKGSVTLGWRPAKGWDVSLKLRRRVGQISFYDFLAQPKLSQDRENAGNPDLVPPQSWEVETEFGRDLGAWGKTRLNAPLLPRRATSSTSSRSATTGRASAICRARPLRRRKHQHDQLRSDRLEGRQARPDARLRMDLGQGPADRRETADQRHPATAGAALEVRHDIPGTPARVERLCPAPALCEKLLS